MGSVIDLAWPLVALLVALLAWDVARRAFTRAAWERRLVELETSLARHVKDNGGVVTSVLNAQAQAGQTALDHARRLAKAERAIEAHGLSKMGGVVQR